MNILLIGSGGREHALLYAIKKSPVVKKIFATPGNPGIFSIATNPNIYYNNSSEIINFCKNNSIDLVVIGPELPLEQGLTDILKEYGINVFGPSKKAARLETSKIYAKEFMKRHKIPTAKFAHFGVANRIQAHYYLDTHPLPIVLKADGLAAGKGVIIANTHNDAHKVLDLMYQGLFKEASSQVVIEEFLEGQEASILAISDGFNFVTLAPSQDHKRAFDNDEGKNTGGMGSYAPTPLITENLLEEVKNRIIIPTIKGMNEENNPFIGCLYVGLIISDNKPNVIEYNVRFGDPETQSVLSIFDGDFASLLYSASIGSLDLTHINSVSDGFASCVILASEGYPDSYQTGFEITGLDLIEDKNIQVFHSGTAIKDNKLVTAGGRVLGVTAKSKELKSAIKKAYKAIDKINFDNMYYRKDIGKKALK